MISMKSLTDPLVDGFEFILHHYLAEGCIEEARAFLFLLEEEERRQQELLDEVLK